MKNRWGVVLAGCLILGLWGCMNTEPSERATAQPSPLPFDSAMPQPTVTPSVTPHSSNTSITVAPELVTAQTRFGFKLLQHLTQQDDSQNLMISPTSVAIALSMTYNGAAGSTQKAMAEALALQGMSLEQVNQANQALAESLKNADPNVKLAIANSLWGRQDVAFKPEFLQRNQTFYQAEVASLDFGAPASVNRINDWVKQQTEGKIPTIIQELQPNQALVLVNAVYFKGNWTKQFDPKQTSDRPFTLLNGSSQPVPMMSQSGNYPYLETDQFQAISLPYGEGRLSLYVFLPKADFNAFTRELTAENWTTWMAKFSRRQGSLQLPRFRFEYGTSLNTALKAIGMATAFDTNQADFSGIAAEDMVINQVQHKTFIEVNEEGTEAAAATSVGITTTSAPTVPPFQMTVDRPFFTAIRDNQTGTVLFMGRVVEP